MNENSFFALVFRQKFIKRWGLMRNVQSESLSEHACETAVLAHALAVIGNTYFGACHNEAQAVLLALYHDVPEVYTGDLPTPVKYFNDASKQSYDKVERHAISTLLQRIPREMRPAYEKLLGEPEGPRSGEALLVKAADKLSAYIKCVEEEKCGNTEFASAKHATWQALDQMNCPELNWFIQHILPTFSMTLDELQS